MRQAFFAGDALNNDNDGFSDEFRNSISLFRIEIGRVFTWKAFMNFLVSFSWF